MSDLMISACSEDLFCSAKQKIYPISKIFHETKIFHKTNDLYNLYWISVKVLANKISDFKNLIEWTTVQYFEVQYL